MGDTTYLFPVALTWDQGPQELKKLKTKLLLYFGKKNESDGGECEIPNTNCDQGHVLIYFKEETARNAVLQKGKHQLKLPNGRTLPLSVSLPRAGPTDPSATSTPGSSQGSQGSRAIDKDTEGPLTPAQPAPVLLIANVQDNCPTEMLNLLVENLSGRTEEETDFYVERIPEIQAAAVTFTCHIDVQGFLRNFSSNQRVRKYQLTARPLQETASIRVENLPDNTAKELLEEYFESQKRGGGRVEDIQLLPREGAALVTFHDAAVVRRLLTKELMLSRKSLSVFPYYPELGIYLYGKKEPSIEIPEPVEVEMSRYVLEYLLGNEDVKRDIEAKMRSKHCEIRWPDLSCQKPVLRLTFPPSLSTYLRTMTKVVPKWKDEVCNDFSLIKAKYTYREYSMKQRAWEAIRDDLRSPAYSGVLIMPDFASEKVFLAGMCKDVTKIDPTLRKLVEETNKKVERSHEGVTEIVSMSPAFYQIMCNSGLQKKILEKIPELKMDYHKSTGQVHLHGLKDEVLTAKCDILLLIQQWKSKPIQTNPYLTQFLMSTNKEKLSLLLFVRHKIHAALEDDGNALKLTASSEKDWTKAEEQIAQELIIRHVLVEERSLLRSPQWRSFQSRLMESFNKENRTVLVLECPPGADSDIVTAGLSVSVHKCHQQVSEFLEKNTTIQIHIPIKSSAVMQFIQEKRAEILDRVPKDVQLNTNPKSLCLEGARMHVQGPASHIQNVLSSLYCDTLRIDKPGAKKFCKNTEILHKTTARTSFGCVIHLEYGEEDEGLIGRAVFQVTLPTGLTISIYRGDLCRHNVDVIINAANRDLQHVGGLAKAIEDAAGPKLKEDSAQIIRKGGPVADGESVITDAGRLPCKQVIHTVGPRWDGSSGPRCERLLRRAISSSLELAAEKNHSSIAIPAVSSGVFGFPLKLCVENIVAAIGEYVEMAGRTTSLRQIHLVDTKEETIKVFCEVTKAKFGDRMSTSAPTPMERQHGKSAANRERIEASPGSGDSVKTREGLIIRLVQKNIEDCTTDVMVNSVGDDLDLSRGAVSKALLGRAGPGMQQLLNDVSVDTQVTAGSVFPTSGCNLNCQEVLHAVTPQWDGGKGTSETLLRGIIKNCLTQSEQKQRNSLSLPALGTGVLGFPKVLVASVMLDEIFQFSGRNMVQHLQEVHLVLHPTDQESIKAFTGQLSTYTATTSSATTSSATTERQPATNTASTFCGTVSSPSLGIYEMKIGAVTYQVKSGDITKETADIIVNSSNERFTLRSGVSKAILDAAGETVAAAAAALGSQPNKGYGITAAGNIQTCTWILHVTGNKDPASIKKIVLNILQECEKQQAASVAIPALGTGAAQVSAAVIADSILDGVVDYFKSKSSSSLQTVKVVIFQQQMLNDFYTSMKKLEGTPLPQHKSLFTRFTEFFLPPKAVKPPQKLSAFQLMEGIEPVVFSLCAEEKASVDKTKAWLLQQIEYEQAERVITEECISELEDVEFQKISNLQKQYQVKVIYKPPNPSIKITGLTRDVLAVTGDIEKIINRVKDKKHKEQAADLTAKLVEWQYSHGGSMVPFDKLTNLELEDAKKANLKRVTIQSHGTQLTVNIQNETATDRHGNQVEIQRIDKQNMSSLPSHWKAMGNTMVMEVDVSPGTPEYTRVQQKFQRSCRNTILKILRVQNAALWQQYQIRKQHIDAKNKSTTNEMEIFHGTDSSYIQHINLHGFNRSYAGRNAAAYGNGTYFAINASYSASSTYARPDASGQKHMYLARVLTGEYCAGHHGMVMPPAKSSADPTDLYDSATDNVQRPSMFVIFHDVQAYPEYHIVFQ
ncbi:protein mono-ADP-ribosyltransferase PARP14-like [Gastrophryne carolinensis]